MQAPTGLPFLVTHSSLIECNHPRCVAPRRSLRGFGGVASGPAEPPRNWFGEVGAVDVEDVRAKLIPMLYPHMFASVTSDADMKRLDEQKAELRELQSKAVDLRARSKLDPFAAFTADAKGREAKRLDKTISLAAAESEVHAWRATRDLLREQLAEAEKQHLDWRRKYREIERKR